MPRKRRTRKDDGRDDQNDVQLRLPSRIPYRSGYITWGERSFGRTLDGPAPVPTGVSSELDFSHHDDDEGEKETPSQSPSTPSPTRSTASRGSGRQRRRKARGNIQDSHDTEGPSGSGASATFSSPVATSAGDLPDTPHDESSRTVTDARTRARYHPYMLGAGSTPGRAFVPPLQRRLDVRRHAYDSTAPQAGYLYPAPAVGMPPTYNYTEAVTDDAQQHVQCYGAPTPFASQIALDSQYPPTLTMPHQSEQNAPFNPGQQIPSLLSENIPFLRAQQIPYQQPPFLPQYPNPQWSGYTANQYADNQWPDYGQNMQPISTDNAATAMYSQPAWPPHPMYGMEVTSVAQWDAEASAESGAYHWTQLQADGTVVAHYPQWDTAPGGSSTSYNPGTDGRRSSVAAYSMPPRVPPPGSAMPSMAVPTPFGPEDLAVQPAAMPGYENAPVYLTHPYASMHMESITGSRAPHPHPLVRKQLPSDQSGHTR